MSNLFFILPDNAVRVFFLTLAIQNEIIIHSHQVILVFTTISCIKVYIIIIILIIIRTIIKKKTLKCNRSEVM